MFSNRYLVYEFVDGSLPFQKDLVEASKATGICHISRVGDRHSLLSYLTGDGRHFQSEPLVPG